MTARTKPAPTHRKAGKARRPDGSIVTLWRVVRPSPDLWCRGTGRLLVEGEEFTKAHLSGHAGPVPVCRLHTPFEVTERW